MRVFPRAVITTAIGANVVTSQAYHRILKRVDNHVLIDFKEGRDVVRYVDIVLFFAKVICRATRGSTSGGPLHTSYIAVVYPTMGTPTADQSAGRPHIFRYEDSLPQDPSHLREQAYSVPIEQVTAKACIASDIVEGDNASHYAMEVSTTFHMR